MGILDDLKKWAHPYEDEDEEYEDDFPDLRDRGDTGAFADRRSAERFLAWAAQIGPHTAHAIAQVLHTRAHPQQGYRTALGILRLAKA